MASGESTGYEVELGYPLDDSHLGSAIADSTLEVTFVRGVPTGDVPVPYFVVRGTGLEAVDELLTRHPDVDAYECLSRGPHGRLYRCAWRTDDEGIVATIHDHGGIVRRMTGDGAGWSLVVFFPTNDHTTRFHRACLERGLDIDVRRVEPAHVDERRVPDHGLSAKQLEAVRLAYERGYFETPKQTTLTDVAADLGISEQALSQRLRRATRRLVESAVDDLKDEGGTRPHRRELS